VSNVYKPPKPPLTLKSVPRFSEVYWCDFSISAVLPEFDDRHPVMIVRSGQHLHKPHVVLPLTSTDQTGNAYAYRFGRNPVPGQGVKTSWAICDQLYAVATERLDPIFDNRLKRNVYPKIHGEDLRKIGVLVRRALHRLIEASLPPAL
jgi:mRNA interferase MazF